MYGQENNWTTDYSENYQQWSKRDGAKKRTKPRSDRPNHLQQCTMNEYGDTVFKDLAGTITSFRYNDQEAYYSFEYSNDGSVCSISRSDGFSWSKVDSNGFNGWVIRNMWESWSVDDRDCGVVEVDECGIRASGKNADLLGLPERE